MVVDVVLVVIPIIPAFLAGWFLRPRWHRGHKIEEEHDAGLIRYQEYKNR